LATAVVVVLAVNVNVVVVVIAVTVALIVNEDINTPVFKAPIGIDKQTTWQYRYKCRMMILVKYSSTKKSVAMEPHSLKM
jgi:hypothetical protein